MLSLLEHLNIIPIPNLLSSKDSRKKGEPKERAPSGYKRSCGNHEPSDRHENLMSVSELFS
ncbi:MAG: hypothetical protein OQJ89_03535, partial [Kangiellaceae bacterium]|nr:hypothetical protein [Kangiellaceae bacterium]